ncbi:MAG: hypothetical protein ACLQVX_12825 [Limisphaerales bacterium]
MPSNNPAESARVEAAHRLSRRQMLWRTAGLAATAWTVGETGNAFAADAGPPNSARNQGGPKPSAAPGKTVYLSFLFHGNMCYDRYTKQEIRDKFPRIYATGVRALKRFPEVTAHIDFPGLTLLSLRHHAPWFLDELKPLVDRGQVVMAGCQYAASQALCSDEESDVVANRVTMGMMRREFGAGVSAFFPQEAVFHPQMPYIMGQAGVRRLLTWTEDWQRPRRVRGLDGSLVLVYPINWVRVGLGHLEEYYDTHQDGSFVMSGGDFEQLGDLQAYRDEIARLAAKGKIIQWTTVDRYEKEVGIRDECPAPHPFGHSAEDIEANPSFSRWTTHPNDIIWHSYGVRALEAARAAGFAGLCAALHKLGPVDVPLAQAETTAPDNPWDARFEEANEYPETESGWLASEGRPTLLSRAWHHLLIGLNSDASGWFPWTPRTRHREAVLQTSQALSDEVLARFARRVASRLRKPRMPAKGWVLALNPAPARAADISLDVEESLCFAGADGTRLPAAVTLREGKWRAESRIELPAYGYRLLALQPASDVRSEFWTPGRQVAFEGRQASLADGHLTLSEGASRVEIGVGPFKLSDPSGVAPVEQVAPNWAGATSRVRQTVLGPDLEVFTELAWAVWFRLVISLREDRCLLTAEVHVDMPRRIGNGHYDPNGLLLEFRGQPGRGFYDVPYATIEHTRPEPSFVAAQRFAALAAGPASFTVVARWAGASPSNLPPRTDGSPPISALPFKAGPIRGRSASCGPTAMPTTGSLPVAIPSWAPTSIASPCCSSRRPKPRCGPAHCGARSRSCALSQTEAPGRRNAACCRWNGRRPTSRHSAATARAIAWC